MAVLSRTAAVEVVSDQAAVDLEPTLTGTQVEAIVDRAARMDADGNAPGTDDWTATYDLNAATAMAWERKAALTATAKFDLTVDGQTLRRKQVYDHCVAEAKRYRNRVAGTLRRTEPENFSGYDVVRQG
jgi:hypothetical protein